MTNPAPAGQLAAAPTSSNLEDSPLAELLGRVLRPSMCWAAGLGWLQYDGKVWASFSDPEALEIIRLKMRELHAQMAAVATTPEAAKACAVLLSKYKLTAMALLLKGVLARKAADFDADPDYLNVQNGYVYLPTGRVYPHDPEHLCTKIAAASYDPYDDDVTHEDWESALSALPDIDVVNWLQVRLGQGLTGHMTSDHVVPFFQGSGANGKSTLVDGVKAAAGTYATMVPEKVLLASPHEHSTSLTTLMGARLAFIEELPEGGRLNTKRLKDLAGTSTVTARRMREDDVTWNASHSLLVNTNHTPTVSDTDYSVWRRLALVKFPVTFKGPYDILTGPMDKYGDPALPMRLRDGKSDQHKAILAWLIDGARFWYASNREMPEVPETVQKDTLGWRAQADLILSFAEDRLEYDAEAVLASAELYETFCTWLFMNGHPSWSRELFNSRFEAHESTKDNHVTKGRKRVAVGFNSPPSNPVAVWTGVRLKVNG